ncbi:MAG: GtrA family protein [Oscillospiraceae bacterium]|nr:GtrA family protein [Oscillospiraceae bacterium]
MIGKLRAIFIKYRSIITYLIFGVFTTVVNYLVYYPLYNFTEFSATVSNGISWLAAVIFAYFTNKLFVFESKRWDREVVIPEFAKFIGGRLASGVAETAVLFVFVDLLDFNGNVWKIITSVLVVILNFVFSKYIVFKKSP